MPTKTKIDWAVEAAQLPSDDFKLNVPLYACLGEAQDTARYFDEHYEADKKAGRPGFASAGLPRDLGEQIEALVHEVSLANSAYHKAIDPKIDASKLERAAFLLDEIGAAMEFLLDDGVEDDDDRRLANVQGAHKDDPFTADALALALEDYANLAEDYEKRLDGLGDFDVALLAEARALAKELRAMPPSNPAASAASKTALGFRNRLLQLLDQRVRRVRAAARYVFRRHPELARQAGSAYERKRRVEARRAKAKEKAAEPTPAP